MQEIIIREESSDKAASLNFGDYIFRVFTQFPLKIIRR